MSRSSLRRKKPAAAKATDTDRQGDRRDGGPGSELWRCSPRGLLGARSSRVFSNRSTGAMAPAALDQHRTEAVSILVCTEALLCTQANFYSKIKQVSGRDVSGASIVDIHGARSPLRAGDGSCRECFSGIGRRVRDAVCREGLPPPDPRWREPHSSKYAPYVDPKPALPRVCGRSPRARRQRAAV